MSGLEFEWDPSKAAKNLRDHGVSFEEARSVVENLGSLVEYDAAHSLDEDRVRVIGDSEKRRLIVVIVTDREDRIRIISARKATAKESRDYAKAKL